MDKSIDKIDSEKKKNSCEKNFNKIFKVLEELKVSIDNLDGKKEIEENQI